MLSLCFVLFYEYNYLSVRPCPRPRTGRHDPPRHHGPNSASGSPGFPWKVNKILSTTNVCSMAPPGHPRQGPVLGTEGPHRRARKALQILLGDSRMGGAGSKWTADGAGVQEGRPGPAGPRARAAPASALERSVGELMKGWGRPVNPQQVGAPRPAPAPGSTHSVLLRLSCQGSGFRKSWSLAFENFFQEANKVNLTLLQGGGAGVRSCICASHLAAPPSPPSRAVLRGQALGAVGGGPRGGWGLFWVLLEHRGGVLGSSPKDGATHFHCCMCLSILGLQEAGDKCEALLDVYTAGCLMSAGPASGSTYLASSAQLCMHGCPCLRPAGQVPPGRGCGRAAGQAMHQPPRMPGGSK